MVFYDDMVLTLYCRKFVWAFFGCWYCFTCLNIYYRTRSNVFTKDIPGIGKCLSAFDFIKVISEKDSAYAKNQLIKARNSTKSGEEDLVKALNDESRKFVGRNNGEPTPFLTYNECLILCNYLPVAMRSAVSAFLRTQVQRIHAGDQSLHAEVDRNAASGGIAQTMARTELQASGKLPVIQEDPEERAIRKRKMLAEVEMLEAGAVAKRAESAYEYKRICVELLGDSLDDRDMLYVNDTVRNVIFGHHGAAKAITNGDGNDINEDEQLFADDILKRIGVKSSNGNLKSVGQCLSAAYKDRYNEAPPKHERFVDGAIRKVNYYTMKDLNMLVRAARDKFNLEPDSDYDSE